MTTDFTKACIVVGVALTILFVFLAWARVPLPQPLLYGGIFIFIVALGLFLITYNSNKPGSKY